MLELHILDVAEWYCHMVRWSAASHMLAGLRCRNSAHVFVQAMVLHPLDNELSLTAQKSGLMSSLWTKMTSSFTSSGLATRGAAIAEVRALIDPPCLSIAQAPKARKRLPLNASSTQRFSTFDRGFYSRGGWCSTVIVCRVEH